MSRPLSSRPIKVAKTGSSRGVYWGYVSENATLTVLRGRIRVADQLARRPGFLLPLEVAYDEYSVDITENRLLRSAIRRVRDLSRFAFDVRAHLGHLDGQLDGVTPLVPGARLPEWHPAQATPARSALCNRRWIFWTDFVASPAE